MRKIKYLLRITLVIGLVMFNLMPIHADMSVIGLYQDDEKAKQAEYEKLIQNGDRLFKAKELKKALEAYQKASELMPYEEYPRNQMQVIETTLSLQVIEEEKRKEEEAKKAAEAAEKKQAEQQTEVVEEPVAEKEIPQAETEKVTIESILAQFQDRLAQLDDKEDRLEKALLFTEIADKLREAGFHAKALEYLQKSLMVEDETETGTKAAATIYDGMAEVYLDSGAVDEGIKVLEKAIELKTELGDKKGVSENLSKIGNAYENTYNYDNAIEYYERSAKTKTDIDDKEGLSEVMGNMGNIYYKQKILEKSIESYEQSAALQEEIGDNQKLQTTYNKLGVSYYELGNFDEAEKYYNQALTANESTGDKKEASSVLNNLGNLNYSQSKFKKSVDFYEKSISMKEELDDKAGLGLAYYNMANSYRQMGDSKKAIDYFEKSREQAVEQKQDELIGRNVTVLAELYSKEKQESKAAEYSKLAENYSNMGFDVDDQLSESDLTSLAGSDEDLISILKEEVLLQKRRAEIEAEQRAKENKINSLKLQNQTEQIKRQRILLSLVAVVAIVVLIAVILLNIQIKQKKKANKKLVEQNELISNQQKLITDNIKSASVIQRAVMPPDSFVQKELPEHFILNMPKDIVSGDFYWMEKRGEDLFVAVADCTGHGVQGAIVTMLGISTLNEIVNKNIDQQPSTILQQLKEKVTSTLHAEGDDVQRREGMDMSLIKINESRTKLEFSGAKNPLYIVRNNEVIVYKADRSPIGYHTKDVKFTTTTVDIEKGDSLYMFSDGYADQLGGKELKKFLAKRFQDVLIEANNLSMGERKEKLVERFDKWRGEYPQVDDIMVMGIKIT